MRIDELTFSQARALKPAQAGEDIDDIIDALYSFDYELAGSGMYSEVYEKPGSNIVVKVNEGATDECWMKFAAIAKANKGNPHLPKIGRVMISNDNFMIVFMEKLEHQNLGAWGFKGNAETEFYDLHDELEAGTLEKNMDQMTQWPKTLLQTLVMLDKAKPANCAWDFHGENVMWRGKTPVITDPWS